MDWKQLEAQWRVVWGDAIVSSGSFLPNIAVNGLSKAAVAAKTSSGLLTGVSAVGHFFKGLGKDLVDAVKGIGHAVAHLPTTLKNIADLNNSVNSARAGLAMYQAAQSKIHEFKNGNLNTRAEMAGAGVGEILQLFGGEVAEVGKVGEIAKVAEFSEDVGRMAEAAKTSATVADGSFYSVAFETKLASTSYPGLYRGAHFLEANKALSATMEADAKFGSAMSELGVRIPRSPSGSILGKSPANFVWHHDVNAGVMQLVPKYQHTVGSQFWNTLHPGGVGGFSIWGK